MSTQHKSVEAQPSFDSGAIDCFSKLNSVDLGRDRHLSRDSSSKIADSHEKQLIQRGVLPDTRIKQHNSAGIDNSDSCSILISKTSTNEQKLHAIEKLVGQGKTQITVVNENGKSVDVRLEVEKVGHRRMVHMFAIDDCGKEKTVLRGISKGDHYEAERDKRGHFVSYEGKGASLMANVKSISSAGESGRGHASFDTSETGSRTKTGGSNRASARSEKDVATRSNSDNVNPPADAIDKTVKCQASARGTAYYPFNNALEGGFKDKLGKDLCTLQAYLRGEVPYVSVAMDESVRYGSKLCIPELNAKYGRNIEFRVVDTGGAFKGKGHSRIDICVANEACANDSVINGHLTLQFV